MGYTSLFYFLFSEINTPSLTVMWKKPTDTQNSKFQEPQSVLLMDNFHGIESATLIYPGWGQESRMSRIDINNIVQEIEW